MQGCLRRDSKKIIYSIRKIDLQYASAYEKDYTDLNFTETFDLAEAERLSMWEPN